MTCSTPPKASLRDETAVLAFHPGCGWDLESYRGGVAPRSYQKLEAVN